MPKDNLSENKTIFVGNIPPSITAEVLHESFSPFGDILDIQIPIDPHSRTNRNFAFITFQNQIEALEAIDNMHLNVVSNSYPEKILKVNLARNSFQNTNLKKGNNQSTGFSNLGNNRAIWDDEDWIKENALKEPPTNPQEVPPA